MGRATAAVLFPDGLVRWGIYNGTSDIVMPRLFTTSEAAWDAWMEDRSSFWPPKEATATDEVPVKIWTNYGNGFEWAGTATPDYITGGLDPYETERLLDGTPQWVP